MQTKSDKQTAQFLKPVPKKLAQLIETVNLLKPDQDLPDLTNQLADVRLKDEEWPKRANDALMDILKDMPNDFRDYIWNTSAEVIDPIDAIEDAVERYVEFDNARKRLRAIAGRAKKDPQLQRPIIFLKQSNRLERIKFDEHGCVHVSKDSFTKAMEEKCVEGRRIRDCEVCKRIFWAGRLDKRCCSDRCGNNLRTRIWRENYQTKYKIRRIDKENELEAQKRQSKTSTTKKRT